MVVLENMFANAWKFSENAPRNVLEFGAIQNNGDEAYFVRDNGAGFRADHVDKLYNPFQRLSRPHEYTDTGIGLATANRITNPKLKTNN